MVEDTRGYDGIDAEDEDEEPVTTVNGYAVDEAGRPVVKLVGEDGNAFSIIGRCRRAIRAVNGAEVADRFVEEAMSGDYDHVLRTAMEYCDVH